MTIEEARARVAEVQKIDFKEVQEGQFWSIIAQALDKRIPQKPVKVESEKWDKLGLGYDRFECPVCGCAVFRTMNYCSYCGQRLEEG